tara:strand:- start:4422 stop:5972 length:1551 start_codon:yes stop_codon:yes gene_type:complete
MFNLLFKKNLFYFYILLIFGGAICGKLQANDLKLNNERFFLTNKGFVSPPKIKGKNDYLLVGLEPFLGKTTNGLINSTDLKLVSAGKNLILKDAQGIIHKSSEITIGWRKVFLKHPLQISRQVAGPFSSFESAQEFAFKLANYGIESKIAHPKDWEVWVPNQFSIPTQLKMKLFNKQINFVIQPVLKGITNELLLSGPISIEAQGGLVWGDGVYSGPFLLKADAYGTWTFIEKVLFPQYLKGVVPHEIGPGSPEHALAAQTVLARTWAMANSTRFAIDGYHLCSNTQCQVYKNPNEASNRIERAIKLTAGKVLLWDGKPIHAVYHATNGGVMASASEAWSMSPLPYLKPRLDGSIGWIDQFRLPLESNSSVENFLSLSKGAYGNNHYRFRWKRVLTSREIQQALRSLDPNFQLPKTVNVKKRGPSGRVVALQIVGSKNQSQAIIRLDNIRRIFRNLPSTLFVVNQLGEGVWQFSGGGFGHGSGMSQAGAIDLAQRGWNVDKILLHYYPGTEYETLP